MSNPTDHLATVRAALDTLAAHVPTVEGAYGIAGLIALGNAAPAIAALADECERLRVREAALVAGLAESCRVLSDALMLVSDEGLIDREGARAERERIARLSRLTATEEP